jgi:hypothetical protein
VFAEDRRSTQCASVWPTSSGDDAVSIIETPSDTYTTAKTQLQSPKHNPNESNVCLSASLTTFPSVVLPSVASHWFPTASTPRPPANHEAGTRQQHPCIIQKVCQSLIDRHCTHLTCFCFNSTLPSVASAELDYTPLYVSVDTSFHGVSQKGFLRKNLRTPLEL